MEETLPKIPEVGDTGSSGTQQETVEPIRIVRDSPMAGLPIMQAVTGLAMAKPKSFGGEIGAHLLAATFTQLSYQLEETKQELRDTRNELKKCETELSDCRTKAAVLRERIDSYSKIHHLKNLSIAGGTILLGIGIQLHRSKMEGAGYFVAGLGVLFILLGWFLREGGDQK